MDIYTHLIGCIFPPSHDGTFNQSAASLLFALIYMPLGINFQMEYSKPFLFAFNILMTGSLENDDRCLHYSSVTV
jgi:hypothetical protein